MCRSAAEPACSFCARAGAGRIDLADAVERLAGQSPHARRRHLVLAARIPAVLDSGTPGLDEMYNLTTAEPLFQKLETLKVAKWFKDGAEQANILNQEEADAGG